MRKKSHYSNVKRASSLCILSIFLASCGVGIDTQLEGTDEAAQQPSINQILTSLANQSTPAVSTPIEANQSTPAVSTPVEMGSQASLNTEELIAENAGSSEPAIPEIGAASPPASSYPVEVNTGAIAENQTDNNQASTTNTQQPYPVDNESPTAALPPVINETVLETEEVDAADSQSFTGCVGNLAWIDNNRDGKRTTNEQGVAISRIELVSASGNVVDSTSTTTGYYQLCALPGTYSIRFDIPAGYSVTVKDSGTRDTSDSDADSFGVISGAQVVSSRNKTKYDIGFVLASNGSVAQSAENPESSTEPSTEGSGASDQSSQTVSTPVNENQSTSSNNFANSSNTDDIRWGFWVETRNAYQSPLGDADEGVETTFENYSFAHVKALSRDVLRGDTTSKEYVVNVLEAATRTNTALDLQLGSAGEYGWNFSTNRGNFNLSRWKDSVSKFSASADPVAHAAIVEAIENGVIRYIFLIDEPNHKRWSPSWNGLHGSSATGNSNHVSNQDLDDMAAHVKSIFGDDTKTIVRTAPVNLVVGARRGMFVFQHMTHAYLTISSRKWSAGANKGPDKGFEWFLTRKNNHADNTTNLSAFRATNLKPSLMIQAGFESSANPWTGNRNFRESWWDGTVLYPFNGATGYVKTAPGEMDYWIKSLLSPRDPVTGVLSADGIRWVDEFVIFRADRLPTDAGRLPFSSYPHYTSFLDQLKIDMDTNNLDPVIGIPVGWTGD